MQDEIMQQEEGIHRARQFEQEAWNEVIEEKKAENRAKTMHLAQAFERQKDQGNATQPVQLDELDEMN